MDLWLVDKDQLPFWERVKSLLSVASGVVALAIAGAAGALAFVRELTVIEERQAENTNARINLLNEISAVSKELEQIKGETNQHYREDAQKQAQVVALEARVSALETKAAEILKDQEGNDKRLADLRQDLNLRQTDTKGACDVLRQRLDVLTDELLKIGPKK